MISSWCAGFFACVCIVLTVSVAWAEKERRRQSLRAALWRSAYFRRVPRLDRCLIDVAKERDDYRTKLDAVLSNSENAQPIKVSK